MEAERVYAGSPEAQMAYSWMRENANNPMSNDPLAFHRSVQVLKAKSRELTDFSKTNLLRKFRACVNDEKFQYVCKVTPAKTSAD